MLLLLVVAAGCTLGRGPRSAFPKRCRDPVAYAPTGDWRTTCPAIVSLDSAVLQRAFDYVSRYPAARGMVVVRDGYIVAERYFRDADEEWRFPTGSITKTVVATLVGAAVADRKIKDLDQTLASCLRSSGGVPLDKREVTLRQLLTMTAGFDNEAPISDAQLLNGFLRRDLSQTPGTFHFDHGSYHLLGACVEVATSDWMEDYARARVFLRIGIYIRPGDWLRDGIFFNTGHTGLSLSARDMARLGLLYLRHGEWEGREVLPEAWVELAMGDLRGESEPATEDARYAYGWWMRTFGGTKLLFATGPGGQFLFLFPELDMIVVLVGDPGVRGELTRYERLLEEFILGAVRDWKPPAGAPAARRDTSGAQ